MRILFCSAEVSPFAKVGGLADVAGSLPKALAELGHEVAVVMPGYGMAHDRVTSRVEERRTFDVTMNPDWSEQAEVTRCEADGFNLWLINCSGRFDHIQSSESVYSPSRDDYMLFSMAALNACEALGWMPDVVHAHDWHMGMIPVFMREKKSGAWNGVGSSFTIHNIAFQGEFERDTLEAAGLPTELFRYDRLETFGKVNFLKSGCSYADQVNTVSPTYAHEITTEEFGYRLASFMTFLRAQKRLRGILNGIDTDRHDPATDPELPSHFSAENPATKEECRRALLGELGLDLGDEEPLMAMICRLSEQKGFDVVVECADEIIECGAGLVFLALGDPEQAQLLRRLEARHPGKVRFIQRFDPELAQRIYGGSDMFLMPSAFEPCGLGQMFAMRYGTVPVVRYTGGLADTVQDGINGFVFGTRSYKEFLSATKRAISAFRNNDDWRRIQQAGMEADFSWAKSADKYVDMYADAMSQRSAAIPV